MSLRLAIVADDLTGALDSAEPFARVGFSVVVATSIAAIDTLSEQAPDVVAVNTDSRALAPEAAAMAIRQAWARLGRFEPEILFKKIDSRMKGNVAAEVAALAEASGRHGAIVAPAIPAMGRVVHGGLVSGFGVDVSIAIPLLHGWEVPDCADDGEMSAIANQALASRADTIAVGASGFAEALARMMAEASLPVRSGPLTTSPGERRMIMAIGSRDPITLEQVEVLRGGMPKGDAPIILQPLPGLHDPEQVSAELAERALTCASENGITTLLLSGGDTAAAFIQRAGVGLLVPLGSLARGMPVARGSANGVTYTLITKSGGFGAPEALVEAWGAWSAE